MSRSGRDGVAVAGEEGRATSTQVVVGERGEAEVLEGNSPMFAAGVRSGVHAGGIIDYEADLAYRVRFALDASYTLER